MSVNSRWVQVFAAAAALGIAAVAGAAELKLDPALLERGKPVFDRECAVCHGPAGRGDGPAAYLLIPKPRDFTSQLFKIRSTPEGSPPTRADLLRTLQRGMPGSAMASYGSLPEADLRSLVEYVLSLAGFTEEAGQPVQVPRVPPMSADWIAKGKILYQDFGCFECHGPKGDGRGTSAGTLKDAKNRPILPNDFTRGVFKGGSDPQSVMTRFVTGMDGTPMPSFAEAAKPEQLIALTQYVMSLSEGREIRQPGTGVVPARKIGGSLPVRPGDPAWNGIPATVIPLMHLNNDGRPPLQVAVAAAHDGDRIAIRLEWADASFNDKTQRTNLFADAAAVQFSLGKGTPPLFAMGSRGLPVNIWFWNAAAAGGRPKVSAQHPGMHVDDYPFTGQVYPRQEMGPPGVRPAETTRPPFITAWAAKNPNSTPGMMKGVMDMNAEGFGTIQPQKPRGQNVTGTARWTDGVWRIVFTRPLANPDAGDADLRPGSSRPIAFALWDGDRRDRNGQKAVTTWYTLQVE